MTWVIPEAVKRLRAEWGLFYFDEWETFAYQLRVPVMKFKCSIAPSGFTHDGVIYINAEGGRSRYLIAYDAWHEIGHILLTPGNRERIIKGPQGIVTLGKTEVRAHEFAACFPVWPD